MVLVKMKMTNEAYLNYDVENVITTVPSYFSNSHRNSTRYATTVSVLNAMKIINEPATAAIAYGFDIEVYFSNGKKIVLSFNLGGCTFDYPLLMLREVNLRWSLLEGTHIWVENILTTGCSITVLDISIEKIK